MDRGNRGALRRPGVVQSPVPGRWILLLNRYLHLVCIKRRSWNCGRPFSCRAEGRSTWPLGHAYAVSGQRTAARELLRKLEHLANERYVSAYSIALIYVGLAEKDRALESLERAFRRRSPWMVFLKVDPRLDPLRADPRYADLMKRVGLPLQASKSARNVVGYE